LKKLSIYFLPIFLTLSVIGCENDKSFLANSNKLKNLPPLKFAQPAEPLPEKNFPYELNTDISFAGKFNVYRLLNKKFNKNQFIELANKFEVFPLYDSITYNKDTSTFSYTNESISINAEQKGIFNYSITKKPGKINNKKIALPADLDAEKTAKEYLTKLDLLPEDSFTVSISTIPSGENKLVVFNIKANNKPISGAAKIEVYVGAEGKIEGVSSHYRDYTLLGKRELRNIQIALDDVKNNKGLEYFKSGIKPVKCCINKIELCYYQGSDIENQPYLYPVYRMTGFTLDDKGNKYEYTSFVQAIE